MENSTVVGNAVVFFYASVVTPPATNVKVVPVADLVPLDAQRISEKRACNARIRGAFFPCLVLEINTSKTLDQLRKKAADNEEDYEEAASRWLKELGVPVPECDTPCMIPVATNNSNLNKQSTEPTQPSPLEPVNPIVPQTQNEFANSVVSTTIAEIVQEPQVPFEVKGTHSDNSKILQVVVQDVAAKGTQKFVHGVKEDSSEMEVRQVHSPTEDDKLSAVSEPITPPSAPRQDLHVGRAEIVFSHMQKLYIGNLSRNTTENDIRELFARFGELMNIEILADKRSNRFFAFLTYKTAEMVDEVQKNRPHSLHGQELKTKRVYPREVIYTKSFEAGALSQGTQVFVHGLKENISEQDLAEYFGRYGVIVRVDIPNNKATGKRLNYGFVTFDDYDTVDKIILTGEHHLKSARLLVKKVNPDTRPALQKGPPAPPPSKPILPSVSSSLSSPPDIEFISHGYGESNQMLTNHNGWETDPGAEPVVSSSTNHGPSPSPYQSHHPSYGMASRPSYSVQSLRGSTGAPVNTTPMRSPFSRSGRLAALPYPPRGEYSPRPRGRGIANGFRQ